MIKKKKFMMEAPDPTQSGIQAQQAYGGQLAAPNREVSNSSALKRDGSLNKFVNEKHLGPSALKDRKPLANWPKDTSNQNQSNNKFEMGTPQKSKKNLPPYMQNDN